MKADDYISSSGGVARGKIALGIKRRIIKRPDIEQLVSDKRIQSGFISGTFKKVSKKEWNKYYLDVLSCVAIAECFNKDYLLYLDEVADFVSKARFRKIALGAVIVVLVIIAGVIVLIYTTKNTPKEPRQIATARISDTVPAVEELQKAQEDGVELYEIEVKEMDLSVRKE